MLVRVARAIALTENGDGFDDPWEPFQCHARAVLEALRDPSAAMHTAGNIADINDYDYREVWIEMIDAALADKGGG